jgi:hypothetical protein
MFFVKSFKASDLYRGTVWWIDPTYTRRKSIASKYISSLRAPERAARTPRNMMSLADFDQGVAGAFKTCEALSTQEQSLSERDGSRFVPA